MNHFQTLGRTFLILGAVCMVIGLALLYKDRLPWLGRLPGDLYIKREGFTFYFPLATCLLISLIISLLMRLFRR